MTKLEFLAHALGHLRREASNRLSRHAIVTACAVGGDAGSSLAEMAARLGENDPNAISTQVSSYADRGLLLVMHGTRPRRYTVSPLGVTLIAPMLEKPQTQPEAATA